MRIFLAFAAFIALAASGVTLPGFCLFRALVDLDCPGCGITRSIVALVSGDLARSFALQPAGIVVVAFFAAIAIADLMRFERAAVIRYYANRALAVTLAVVWGVRVIIPRWL